jgi:hypothetical protein
VDEFEGGADDTADPDAVDQEVGVDGFAPDTDEAAV